MTYRTLLPSSWLGDKDDDDSPFGALRKQIDTLLEDFDTGFSTLPASFALRSNVSETDEAICITAELPGVELDDVDVSVTGNRITVKGVKKSEDEEEGEKDGRQFHRVERSSGSFRRSMTLPFDIDPDTVTADTKNGVLTVMVPKPPEAVSQTKKIAITKSK